MTFAIKFQGVLLNKARCGYVNPEKGEYNFDKDPKWFTPNKEQAEHMCFVYNFKSGFSFNGKEEGYRVVEVFKISPLCFALLDCSKDYWEINT
jgi:hypothetical protein